MCGETTPSHAFQLATLFLFLEPNHCRQFLVHPSGGIYAHVSKLPIHALNPLLLKNINSKILHYCSLPCIFLQQSHEDYFTISYNIITNFFSVCLLFLLLGFLCGFFFLVT